MNGEKAIRLMFCIDTIPHFAFSQCIFTLNIAKQRKLWKLFSNIKWQMCNNKQLNNREKNELSAGGENKTENKTRDSPRNDSEFIAIRRSL